MRPSFSLLGERAPSLAKNPYTFISRELERCHSKVCDIQLLFQKTTIMKGADAARVFYNSDLFVREGAAPNWVKKTLFGEDGVQMQDGAEHRRRKHALMHFMDSDSIRGITEAFSVHWERYFERWQTQRRVILLEEMQTLLCEAICQWAGIPLEPSEIEERTQDLVAMIEGPGSLGIGNFQARLARKRAEQWVRNLLQDIRDDKVQVDEKTAVYAFAHLRDAKGQLLDLKPASVDLLNILRPTVAIAWYIVFEALALHRHPEWIETLRNEYEKWEEPFVQEVRRFYPFFPFVAAKVKEDFEWQGHLFKKSTRTLLDLYGTNHDPDVWDHPHIFHPERFLDRKIGLYDFIPQGGGLAQTNHRCPGEGIVVDIMKKTLYLLTKSMEYSVPAQDLEIDFASPPAAPRSGFVMDSIRPRPENDFYYKKNDHPWFITSGSTSH